MLSANFFKKPSSQIAASCIPTCFQLSMRSDLRVLSNRLFQVQDEEWRRISRELHDTAGQKLIGLCVGLSWVLQNANLNLPPGEKQRLTECFTLANEAGNEIWTLVLIG